MAIASTVQAQTPQGWTTSGTRILTPAGNDFVISGINWYGFETTTSVARGLFSRDYKPILDHVKQYGFNTIRIPFSSQMWQTNPVPAASQVSACPSCAGKRSRDILAMIVNYAGTIGLHVILDNHRSTAGNSTQENGLWYTAGYPEQSWIRDWVDMQAWVHGIQQTMGAADTVTVSTFASDGFPTVIGFDLRNEPHSPANYMGASTWGTGDGINPSTNPNPNAFAPACVATSTCHDWRLAAQRAANTILGDAATNQWEYPLMFVEGVQYYPQPGKTAAAGPYDNTWWGANLMGINGNSTNPGAPIVLNAGGDATGLGPPVYNNVVYSVHDYGPELYPVAWFNSTTCYATGCSASSLADVWTKYWAHLTFPGGINPVWPGQAGYPWSNTGHNPVDQAPVYIGEFGTPNQDTDLFTTGPGSQGQWMTSLVNFIESSYTSEGPLNESGVPVSNLHWTYWSLNADDLHALLGANYSGLANAKKEYSFLCYIQQGLIAVPMGSSAGTCGSTGALPVPDSTAAPPPPPVATAPTVTVWWPTEGAELSGVHPFKGLVVNMAVQSYAMYWQVDGDRLNPMGDSLVDGPHKEALVDVSTWTWRGRGPYAVNFVAQDLAGTTFAEKRVDIYVAQPPVAPTNLTATPGPSSRQIQLSWQDNSPNETEFTIERCAGSSCTSFSHIATVTSNVTSYTDSNRSRNKTYRYRIRAQNSWGNSAYSNITSAKAP